MATAEETEISEPTELEETKERDPTDETAQIKGWAARIDKAEREVVAAEGIWSIAKEEVKRCKEEFDVSIARLRRLIRERNDPQRMLPLDGQPEEQPADVWKAATLEQLEISGQTYVALAEAGIKTLGDIAKYTAEFALTDIKGIGPAKAEALEAKLSDWWAAHPEFCQDNKDE